MSAEYDVVARAGGMLAIALGGVLTAYEIVQRQTPRVEVVKPAVTQEIDPKVQAQLDSLVNELDQNLIADCYTENMVRALYKVGPADKETCEQERDDWQLDEQNDPGSGVGIK